MTLETLDQAARILKCTPEQAAAQYLRNAQQLREFSAIAEARGMMYRGRTAAAWIADALRLERIASGEQ